MKALGLIMISKKKNFVRISLKKISECKKWGWAGWVVRFDGSGEIWGS